MKVSRTHIERRYISHHISESELRKIVVLHMLSEFGVKIEPDSISIDTLGRIDIEHVDETMSSVEDE